MGRVVDAQEAYRIGEDGRARDRLSLSRVSTVTRNRLATLDCVKSRLY